MASEPHTASTSPPPPTTTHTPHTHQMVLSQYVWVRPTLVAISIARLFGRCQREVQMPGQGQRYNEVRWVTVGLVDCCMVDCLIHWWLG